MQEIMKRLFCRKVSVESSNVQEDLRKIGVVLIGAGVASADVSPQGNFLGFFVIAIGIALWLYGLTEPR